MDIGWGKSCASVGRSSCAGFGLKNIIGFFTRALLGRFLLKVNVVLGFTEDKL